MQRIGLYGGSFDPIHLGHLLVARAAIEELALDQLFFIPAAQSPFKPASVPASAPARLQFLRLALAGQTRCAVDAQEISRGGVSYTIDTVRDYLGRFSGAQMYWLIGADHVATLPKWREAAELARLVEFIVIARPGQTVIPLPPPFHGCALHGFPFGVSSSQIRERVRAGLSIDGLVPAPVAEAIRNSGLYL